MRPVLVAAGALVALSAPLAACSSDDSSSSTTAAKATTKPSKVSESDVWARPGTKGGNSAIYMTITGGSEPDALTAASVPTDVAAKTEVHETVTSGSTTAMGGDQSTTTAMGGQTTTTAMGGQSSTTAMGGGNGMMSMRPVDRIDVPANGTLMLKPGGYHVMLLTLAKDLKVGDTVKVTLTFEKAGEQTVDAVVKQP